jgi:hypothetical protein
MKAITVPQVMNQLAAQIAAADRTRTL